VTYKYYSIGLPTVPTSASAAWINDFQAGLTYLFDNSTDVFDILEETVFASDSYSTIQVRVTSATSAETGIKLGDDFKRILFKDINHPISVGAKYYFDENFWVVINCENIKSLTASATVRRCNNVLKWMSGSSIYQEPCAIEYSYKNPRFDVSKDDLTMPQAYILIYAQGNTKTNTIKTNQRFLVGNSSNWSCFKVLAPRNFLNQKTLDNSTSQLLTLEVQESQVNYDTDDVVNGIADYHFYTQSGSATAVSSIVISPNSGDILENSTQVFDCRRYSGSSIISGSFIFTVNNANVPTDHYTFSALTANTFSITNNEMYLDYPLTILCSGSSGSRTFDTNLKGLW
jgi:hypothetical protein